MYKINELPETKSMLVTTAEANNLAAVAERKDLYMLMMESICGGKPFLESAEMWYVEKVFNQFQNKRKMDGDEFSQIYMYKLEKWYRRCF